MYNLSIYELSTSDDVCNIWAESISARGAKQIASCILHFIDEQVEKWVKEVHIVSDSYSGQNRNRYMATMLRHAMNNTLFFKK